MDRKECQSEPKMQPFCYTGVGMRRTQWSTQWRNSKSSCVQVSEVLVLELTRSLQVASSLARFAQWLSAQCSRTAWRGSTTSYDHPHNELIQQCCKYIADVERAGEKGCHAKHPTNREATFNYEPHQSPKQRTAPRLKDMGAKLAHIATLWAPKDRLATAGRREKATRPVLERTTPSCCKPGKMADATEFMQTYRSITAKLRK
jgi:hypothetical protein